jgi:hypothetical protein
MRSYTYLALDYQRALREEARRERLARASRPGPRPSWLRRGVAGALVLAAGRADALSTLARLLAGRIAGRPA